MFCATRWGRSTRRAPRCRTGRPARVMARACASASARPWGAARPFWRARATVKRTASGSASATPSGSQRRWRTATGWSRSVAARRRRRAGPRAPARVRAPGRRGRAAAGSATGTQAATGCRVLDDESRASFPSAVCTRGPRRLLSADRTRSALTRRTREACSGRLNVHILRVRLKGARGESGGGDGRARQAPRRRGPPRARPRRMMVVGGRTCPGSVVRRWPGDVTLG